MSIKKRVYYKEFLNVNRTIILDRKFLKLKKKKWSTFIFHFKEKANKHYLRYQIPDLSKISILKYNKKLKYKLKNVFTEKRKFSILYGKLKKKYLRTILNKNINKFLKKLEFRLDVILCRVYFAKNLNQSRQWIHQKKIKINDLVVSSSSFILKSGDFLNVCCSIHYIIINNLKKTFFWPLPPSYLCVNYNTFEIVATTNESNSIFSNNFIFKINYDDIYRYYKILL